MIAGAELQREPIAERLDRGYLDATTLMEHLIARGLPQRTAHHLVGAVVKEAMSRRCRLADLSLEDFQRHHSGIDATVFDCLGVDNAVAAFRSYGSTAPEEVEKQIELWKERTR